RASGQSRRRCRQHDVLADMAGFDHDDAMRFDGPIGLTITTDRHIASDEGRSLTVTDSGFGNVLNGLEFNHTATALLGDRAVPVSLDGAAPAVQDFRACAAGLNA
ncbi:MAG: hypothetical protein JJ912_14180, partial [Roseitalea sp.]|nr:hypothetical protein [Roseitalea sp.]